MGYMEKEDYNDYKDYRDCKEEKDYKDYDCKEEKKYDCKEAKEHKDCGKKGECAKFFPDSIKELLKKLAKECVIITYKGGHKEKVRIECVSGNLLVAKEGGCLFRFIDIDCICAVTAECYDVLEGILNK